MSEDEKLKFEFIKEAINDTREWISLQMQRQLF